MYMMNWFTKFVLFRLMMLEMQLKKQTKTQKLKKFKIKLLSGTKCDKRFKNSDLSDC